MVGVYPRTGGGNDCPQRQQQCGNGLSPHGRGKQPSAWLWTAGQWSIPARAGETPRFCCCILAIWVYPRTGGGNSAAVLMTVTCWGLSPHERGKQGLSNHPAVRAGSIPARAGETHPARGRGGNAPVYPRTGGGNECLPRSAVKHNGLSPHGRGKPTHTTASPRPTRSIPARAGETGPDSIRRQYRRVYPRTGGGNNA